MTKHKRRNTFYWITCEVNTVCQWNLASLCHIPKEKKLSKISQKLRPETKFQALLHLLRIKHNLYSKMKHLKQATYIRLANCISKSIKTWQNQHTDLLRFLFTKLLENWKGPGTSFHTIFMEFFEIFLFCNFISYTDQSHHQTEVIQ